MATTDTEPRFSLSIYEPQTCPRCGREGRHHVEVDAKWAGEPVNGHRPVATTVGYACGWRVDFAARAWVLDKSQGCGLEWERVIMEERYVGPL